MDRASVALSEVGAEMENFDTMICQTVRIMGCRIVLGGSVYILVMYALTRLFVIYSAGKYLLQCTMNVNNTMGGKSGIFCYQQCPLNHFILIFDVVVAGVMFCFYNPAMSC